ncbi:hypothetical protein DPMN_028044 [Dreissena polymorpha]|uniref:Uncharacterized protein n=1 Tax=Dreissena polymorpha TaxID=45954 RepID=A0A9D4LWH4_DREPO|nr:hypothetical protein DPMN_028044 [Dreissena polymorpha]
MDVLQDTMVLSAKKNVMTDFMVLDVRTSVVIVRTRCPATRFPASALGNVNPDITGRCAKTVNYQSM